LRFGRKRKEGIEKPITYQVQRNQEKTISGSEFSFTGGRAEAAVHVLKGARPIGELELK